MLFCSSCTDQAACYVAVKVAYCPVGGALVLGYGPSNFKGVRFYRFSCTAHGSFVFFFFLSSIPDWSDPAGGHVSAHVLGSSGLSSTGPALQQRSHCYWEESETKGERTMEQPFKRGETCLFVFDLFIIMTVSQNCSHANIPKLFFF